MNYAAFIITYKRPEILKKTIDLLFSQTMPPKKILIVDNDIDETARQVKNAYSDNLVAYFLVGSNSGPAGGAYWGLKKLFEEGWEWVLWVDDDDPPSSSYQLETICKLASQECRSSNIGIVGATGVLFNKKKWLIERIPDLQHNSVIDVDMIAGNQFPLVNRKVFDSGFLPNRDLFFGFEDLEFGYRLKKNSFRLIVSSSEVSRLRKHFKKNGIKKKRGLKKNVDHLWREYYSLRTLSLMMKNNTSLFTKCNFILRCIIKVLASFRFGVIYGAVNFKYVLRGCKDGFSSNLGMTIKPINKYNK